MRVACIGEAMVELSLDPSGRSAQVGFAGDTLNTAIYLKRAAPGLDVSYVTVLGRDAFSERLAAYIRNEAIQTQDIALSDARRVGLYAISTDAAGERSFTYWRDNSAARTLFQDGDFDRLGAYDLLYLSAISLAVLPDPVRMAWAGWLEQYRAGGGRVAFDSNHRPALWESPDVSRARVAQFWQQTDIALPSVDDEAAAFGDATEAEVIARLHGYGVRDGALKRGEAGPLSLADPVQQDYVPAQTVVDTTAAGDSFNGGYLAAKLTGATQAEALLAGHDLAARVVGFKGAIAPR